MTEEENQGGRPLKYETAEQLQKKIDAYFAWCEVNEKPRSLSGLADELGISRRTLINYSKKDEFFHTIKRAKQKVERDSEERLISGKGNATGIIFSLKNNFDWEDSSKVDTNMTIKQALVEFSDGQSQSNDTTEV